MILGALELWDVIQGTLEAPDDAASDEEKIVYKASESACTIFLFQTVDPSLYPVLTVNKTPQRVYKALKTKFAMEITDTFLAEFRKLFRTTLGDRSKLSKYLTSFDIKLTRFQHRCA